MAFHVDGRLAARVDYVGRKNVHLRSGRYLPRYAPSAPVLSRIDAPVDVLIVNFRTPELTLLAVAELAGPQVSFWVRDNSGDIEPQSLVAASGHSPSRLLGDGRNTLYAAGNNEIYRLGHAPYVLLLNPDVLLSRSGLGEMLDALGADNALWAVAPRLLNSDGSPQEYYRRFPTLLTVLCDRVPQLRRVFPGRWRQHVYAGESFAERRSIESPPGACLLLDRHQVGPELFDERLSLFYNDTDLCLRMSQRGGRLDLVPTALAEHILGASLSRARARDKYFVARLYDANCLAYVRKNLAGWPLVLAVIMARRLAEGVLRILAQLRFRAPGR